MRLLVMIGRACEDMLILVIDKLRSVLSFLSFQKIKSFASLKHLFAVLKKILKRISSLAKKIISFFHPLNLLLMTEKFFTLLISACNSLKKIKKLYHPYPAFLFTALIILSLWIVGESIHLKKSVSLRVSNLTPFEKIKYATIVSYRPVYYKRYEKQFRLNRLAVPIHIKGKKKLKRIFMDFTVETSSRYLKQYLSKRTHLIENRFNTLIEPIIPELPMEKEGKIIIVQKLKREINQLIKDLNMKGRVEKIHVHSILII